MLVGLSPLRRRVGIGISSREVRFSPQSLLAFTTGRFGGSEFWRGADFVAQQKMLPCATNDAMLRNKGVVGCARRLAGGLQAPRKEVRTSWSRSAHFSSERCALIGYGLGMK